MISRVMMEAPGQTPNKFRTTLDSFKWDHVYHVYEKTPCEHPSLVVFMMLQVEFIRKFRVHEL